MGGDTLARGGGGGGPNSDDGTGILVLSESLYAYCFSTEYPRGWGGGAPCMPPPLSEEEAKFSERLRGENGFLELSRNRVWNL
jgi:hypothetical protein